MADRLYHEGRSGLWSSAADDSLGAKDLQDAGQAEEKHVSAEPCLKDPEQQSLCKIVQRLEVLQERSMKTIWVTGLCSCLLSK